MLKINDRWSRVDRETPQFVVGNKRVTDRVHSVGRYLALPFEGLVERRLSDNGQRILGAIHCRLGGLVIPAALIEVSPQSVQRRWPIDARPGDSVETGRGGQV